MKLLLLTSIGMILSLTSCNKDALTKVDTDSTAPNSSGSSIDVSSNNQDFEIVEFDGFVNISAPIVGGASHEEVVITESGIEMPVFGTSEPVVTEKRGQGGEQDAGDRPE